MKTLIGVFVYNEGEKFERLMQEPHWESENMPDVVVVDDGSTDNATAVCSRVGVTVLRNERNMGIGYSIRRFLHYARNNGYDAVVIMAGNGKMTPSEVPGFLKQLENHDYVQGSRFLEGFRSPNLPRFRRFAIRYGTAFFNCFLRNKITDLSCGFRAYRLEPVFGDERMDIEQDWLQKYELEYYLHYKFDHLGYRVTETPCTMRYPSNSQSYTKIKPFIGWWSMLRPWLYLLLGIRK